MLEVWETASGEGFYVLALVLFRLSEGSLVNHDIIYISIVVIEHNMQKFSSPSIISTCSGLLVVVYSLELNCDHTCVI